MHSYRLTVGPPAYPNPAFSAAALGLAVLVALPAAADPCTGAVENAHATAIVTACVPLPIQRHRQRQGHWRRLRLPLPLLLRRCCHRLCVLLHPTRRVLVLVRQLLMRLTVLTLLTLVSLLSLLSLARRRLVLCLCLCQQRQRLRQRQGWRLLSPRAWVCLRCPNHRHHHSLMRPGGVKDAGVGHGAGLIGVSGTESRAGEPDHNVNRTESDWRGDRGADKDVRMVLSVRWVLGLAGGRRQARARASSLLFWPPFGASHAPHQLLNLAYASNHSGTSRQGRTGAHRLGPRGRAGGSHTTAVAGRPAYRKGS